MRTIDIDPPELPSSIDPHVGLASEKFDISLITPIYGGGAVAGRHDHKFAIRPTSIRGQLRFWWRATVGAQFGTVGELLQQETLIFGSTSRPSPVNVQVTIQDAKPWAMHAPAYAEFPFREIPDKKNVRSKCISFCLELTYPKQQGIKEHLRAALWGWVNFGGLGARTRRGFGALSSQSFSPSQEPALENWFCYGAGEYAAGSRSWPTLPNSLWAGEPMSPAKAWGEAVKLMENFRQVPHGRSMHKARSLWPEAESIRLATGVRNGRHPRQADKPSHAFPRSELGLPIVYQFKDGPKDRKDRFHPRMDPPSTTLRPESTDRMASPVILKPLALSRTCAVPIALLLDTPPVRGLRLDCVHDSHAAEISFKGGRQYSANSVRRPEFAHYPSSPLAKSENGSALEAFLEFVKANGYREVAR